MSLVTMNKFIAILLDYARRNTCYRPEDLKPTDRYDTVFCNDIIDLIEFKYNISDNRLAKCLHYPFKYCNSPNLLPTEIILHTEGKHSVVISNRMTPGYARRILAEYTLWRKNMIETLYRILYSRTNNPLYNYVIDMNAAFTIDYVISQIVPEMTAEEYCPALKDAFANLLREIERV